MGAALSLGVNIAIPLAGGFLIGQSTAKKVESGWYDKLNKPKWNPPSWLFPIAWSLMYTLMGTSSWLIYKDGGFAKPQHVLYLAQLALNFAWNPLFFSAEQPKLALLDITGLLGLVCWTTSSFNEKNETAAKLMYPYIGWVAFATLLNAAIVVKNPKVGFPFGESDTKATTTTATTTKVDPKAKTTDAKKPLLPAKK